MLTVDVVQHQDGFCVRLPRPPPHDTPTCPHQIPKLRQDLPGSMIGSQPSAEGIFALTHAERRPLAPGPYLMHTGRASYLCCDDSISCSCPSSRESMIISTTRTDNWIDAPLIGSMMYILTRHSQQACRPTCSIRLYCSSGPGRCCCRLRILRPSSSDCDCLE